jgi:hypothetical protein
MRRKSLEDLPDPKVPDGFELRTFRAGDEAGWARLMTGAIGEWDEDSTAGLFVADPGVMPEGIGQMGHDFCGTCSCPTR